MLAERLLYASNSKGGKHLKSCLAVQWFVDNVLDLVKDFDHNLPYFITGGDLLPPLIQRATLSFSHPQD